MSYGWDADSYEKHSSPQRQWALDLIRTLEFAGDERVLDIGCGDGKISTELAARVPSGLVLGVDEAHVMIRFAQEKSPPSRFPSLRFQHGDATHLTFCHEFDLVVSFAALHWIQDYRCILQGVKRALKPDGRAVLQFGGEGNAATLLAVTNELTVHERWRRYFIGFTLPWVFYGISSYRDLINEGGLSAKRVELVPKDMVFSGKDELRGWISAVFLPYLERLPKAQREAFTEELAALYLVRQPRDERGAIHVPMVRLEVELTR
ncbi:MAG: methyltransferase domain-containing protein [Euryarchaeota archaeon]|nr:methyltransferase domain-containing protein [Euryarchaeota archaeon]